MPTYSYRCPECMFSFNEQRPIAERDFAQKCMRCAFSDRDTWVERVPTSAAFTVQGFTAKNGYSKES